MPEYSSTIRTKIASLQTLRAAGQGTESYEMVKIAWPSPTGDVWYSVMQTDQMASVAPAVSPIDVRLVPGSSPDWFLPVTIDATIGDEEVDLNFWDGDGVMSQLLVDHGEGIKVELYYWFPQVDLLLAIWQGHLRFEDGGGVDVLPLKAAQGFRSADATVPGRAHWRHCQAIFGGLFTTDAEALEHGPDCPYNKNRGGTTGNNDPSTGLPWTFCKRQSPSDCTARGIDPLFFLAHRTQQSIVLNGQTHGGTLYSASQGNETALKDPVRVVMGTRRIYDMPNMEYRQDLNNNNPEHGWYDALYEGPEGPIAGFSQQYFRVDGKWQRMQPLHYGHRLGYRGQTPVNSQWQTGYSGTSYMRYNFGWIDPQTVEPNEATATAIVQGLNNIRIYTDDTTYTESYSSNRVWQIMRMLCDKRWGFGLDYSRLNKTSWIAAAAWAATSVLFTDTFGTKWTHVRADSHVELVGRKVQQQIEDMCVAGRLSLPFMFDGEIHIVPLAALSSGELAAAPVFTDTGSSRNVVWEDGMTTLRISRKSDIDLPNRIECTYDAYQYDYYETPLAPIEDVAAQLKAGRVVGDNARKINKKAYNLLGVVNESQAVKLGWSLLDLGPLDSGGLQNNLTITFKIWFLDALELHPYKVIKFDSTRLTKYGFSYFRIMKMERESDLKVSITAQAYNPTYMDDFEDTPVDPPDEDPFDPDSGTGPFNGSGHGGPVDIQPIRLHDDVLDLDILLV